MRISIHALIFSPQGEVKNASLRLNSNQLSGSDGVHSTSTFQEQVQFKQQRYKWQVI